MGTTHHTLLGLTSHMTERAHVETKFRPSQSIDFGTMHYTSAKHTRNTVQFSPLSTETTPQQFFWAASRDYLRRQSSLRYPVPSRLTADLTNPHPCQSSRDWTPLTNFNCK